MVVNNVPNPVMVVYTGQDITTIPRNVTHLVVAPNVTTIEAFAFCQCHNLVSVDFHHGLEVIAEFAFGYCTSLEKIRLPSSMRVVGRNVFTRCTRLRQVELNEGLLMLRDGVFSFCLSLKRLWIPSTVTEIERELVFSCSALETLELPPNNTIRSVEEQAMCGCNMLKSLALPSPSYNGQNNNITFGVDIFADSLHLEEQVRRSMDQGLSEATSEGSDLLVTFFRQRFDQLPIHELCYYQSYRPVFETIGKVETLLAKDGHLVKEGKYHQCPTDFFQMTPFHIVALSNKPNYHLLVALQRIYPMSAQYEKDANGVTPIEYILDNMNSASSSSLVDTSGGVLQCMVQSTILDRLRQQGWSYPKHHQEIGRLVEELYQVLEPDQRKAILRQIYSQLSRVERHEGFSILELSIWKAKIKAVNQSLGLDLLGPTQAIHLSDDDDEDNLVGGGNNRTTKRARIYTDDPVLDRQACRVNCGADVIVGNILPFLPPPF